MRCPECNEVTKVIDSRRKPEYIYRRRACSCGTRFSTKEIVFNVVTPDDERRLKEIKRLEELAKLTAAQLHDANQSIKGRMVGGSRGLALDTVEGRLTQRELTGGRKVRAWSHS